MRTALFSLLVLLTAAACADEDMAMGSYAPGGGEWQPPPPPQSGETYEHYGVNAFTDPAEDDLITFGADVDTGSYTLMRSDVMAGRLPAPAGVRVEEYLNYFDYGLQPPRDPEGPPFAVHLEAAPSPFGEGLHLLRVALKGMEVAAEDRPPVNLVFLIDVSGSMSSAGKLDLVVHGLQRLVGALRPSDTLGIAVYAGADGVVLPPTPVRDRDVILTALRNLRAGGSTNGEAGIRAAYALAEGAFQEGGINRVILCSDGDFNVGLTGDALIDFIDSQRARGLSLSVFGFGRGNYNDRDMEQMANHGNGNYAFIDSPAEADRVMVEGLGGVLQTIAKDVKIQVQVDPEHVARYRLIGYENRDIADEDFRDDAVDSGEIGAGHSVTALIELELREGTLPDAAALARVRVRYKAPGAGAQDPALELAHTVTADHVRGEMPEASAALRFAAAVAEYAEILRQSPHVADADLGAVLALARDAARSGDPAMAEFLNLVERASHMDLGM